MITPRAAMVLTWQSSMMIRMMRAMRLKTGTMNLAQPKAILIKTRYDGITLVNVLKGNRSDLLYWWAMMDKYKLLSFYLGKLE
ncbi:hypothetical protein ACHAWO_004260 [Cyclotella atomus]|uniref:Uncharacterized protein n=1 Tax=Cyclotella atomus TaxID=382360 RepID=A0ABD3QC18_9STRA